MNSTMRNAALACLLCLASVAPSCLAFSATASSSVSSLMDQHKSQVSNLQKVAEKYPDAPSDAMFYLRYCLVPKDSEEDSLARLESNLQWRANEGKDIVKAAAEAIAAATSEGGWDNTPVRDMAPHADIVNKYITNAQCLTTTLRTGDLCSCIRAGKIDDVALMSEVSVEQMTEFFLYAKEVNAAVANTRSVATDKVVTVFTANDLLGVKLVGGDATFRKALSAASTKANDLYPGTPGPTFLLNLPRLLGALAKLFTPLFPEEVRKRLKFVSGPLKDVETLVEISGGSLGNPAAREKFLNEIDEILAK